MRTSGSTDKGVDPGIFSYPAGEAERGAARAAGGGRTPAMPPTAHQPGLGDHAKPHTFAWIDGSVQSHVTEGRATVQRGRENLNFEWEAGWERVERREYELSATYARYFNPRWTAFAGYRLTNERGGADGVVGGATYLLPYLVSLTATFHSRGEARVSVGRDVSLTRRLGLFARADYDTKRDFGWQAGLTYTVTKQLSAISTLDSEYGWGAGVGFRF